MTNKKSTKKALITSALCLLLCVSMLVGATFAWFTDSVSSAKNKIVAGNLDVELEWSADGKTWAKVAGADNIFDPNALWEPGRVEVVYLKVSNLGTLALKYNLMVNVYGETAGTNVAGKEFKLSDHLVFKTVEMPDALTTYSNREAAQLAAGTAMGLKDYNGATTALKDGEVDYVALIVYMPETVGNEANYRGNAVPTIELGVNLYATQYTYEEDSYGPDYDGDALVCDILANPETIDDILATVEPGTVIGLAAGKYGTITLTQNDLTLVSNSAVVDCLDLNEKDNIVVDGLTFDAAGAQIAYDAQGAASNNVTNLTDGKANNGGSVGVVIKNCSFIGEAANVDLYFPVYFGDTGRGNRSDDITIENCEFQTNARQYIALNGVTNNSGKTVGKIVIKNNIFGGAGFGTTHNTIQATGQGCNWTIMGNKFYNWNTEKTAIGSSRNGSENLTWTITGNDFYNEDGAVVLALKTSYTDANTTLVFENNTALMGYANLVETPVNAENETVFGGMKIQMDTPVTIVETPEELREALKNNGVVILQDDVKTTDAESNGYGSTGLNVNGGVLDGNGMTVVVDGANTTWDSAIAIKGGTIKNLTVAKGFRGIFIKNGAEKVYLENVIVDGPTYTISCDQAGKQGLEAINCTFNGWTSYAGTIGNAKFVDCSFGAGAGYNFSRPYAPTTYVGCDFAEGHKIDARATITFENCTINGVPLTAENLATLVTSNIANASVIG